MVKEFARRPRSRAPCGPSSTSSSPIATAAARTKLGDLAFPSPSSSRALKKAPRVSGSIGVREYSGWTWRSYLNVFSIGRATSKAFWLPEKTARGKVIVEHTNINL
jgi:hypothetical protein